MANRIRSLSLALVAVVSLLVSVSCTDSRHSVVTIDEADSLLDIAYKAHNYDQLLQLADSFHTTGSISDVQAGYWRGYAYYNMNQLRTADFHWKKVAETEIKNDEDFDYYARSVSRLANLYLLRSDYQSAMTVAVPALTRMEQLGRDTIGDYANLLTVIGSCQLKLGQPSEAEATYGRAFRSYQKLLERDQTGYYHKSAIVGIITTTNNYLSEHRFEEANLWTERFDELLTQFENHPAANAQYIDKQRARLYFYRATALVGLGQPREAAKVYRTALQTEYSQTGDGRIEANDYLMAAGRWREAVYNYGWLDSQMRKYNVRWTIDNIQQYLLPKYRANVGAQQKDSTIAVGLQMCQAIDSAIVRMKADDAAELAALYDSRQKEAQIARQQADLTRQRYVGTLVALLLVSIFFVVYTLYKRKAQQRLADAHTKLQEAYDQLEETTTAKERIESELRIARDIQMSMVPSVFPEREGLDLYASMTPAREVGGDLYSYLLQDDHLYFCIGDVSGKGVPASLFMAQAIRLFRTMAAQQRMPAEIATRMNAALTEDNINGMFITMFIGLVDLTTGRLDFCNAGHNPPVLGGDAQQGSFMEVESNAPIGLWSELEFVGEHLDSIKGRPLFIYTDGLNEAENRQQEQFGEERMLDILRHTQFDNARHVIDVLCAAVEQHRDGAEPNDDLTMMCLKVMGPSV